MTDQLTRRELIERAALGGAAITVPGLLTACGGTSKKAASTTANKTLAKTLRFSNWTYYMDTNNKKHSHPSLQEFEKKFGTHVQYTEDINDNASFFGKIQGRLSRGQSIDRDIVVLTDNDRYLALMIKKGFAEKLDKSAIPNMKNLLEVQRHPSFDPNRDHSLPWQSGMTGIAYNDKLTDPILSLDDMLTHPNLKGKITCLNSKGDVWACFAWSGDMVQLQIDHPGLKWILPKDGGIIWTDNMLIPKGANAYAASVLMNWYYRPEIAAEVEDYVNYICPVVGADKVLEKTDPAVAKNTLIFPTQEMLANARAFDVKAVANLKYKKEFQKLIGA